MVNWYRKIPETTVMINIANWDITRPRLETLRILAQITLLIPTGEILEKNIKYNLEILKTKIMSSQVYVHDSLQNIILYYNS